MVTSDKPLVSIIMPAFNADNFINLAIDSILSQSYNNIELIIVDDCSSDKTPNIINQYNQYQHIKTIRHEKNQGISKSLNDGILLSKGDYIARMDADDLSLRDRIEMQVDFLLKNPHIKFLGTSGFIIDEAGKKHFKLFKPESDAEIKATLPFQVPFIHGSLMYVKSPLLAVGLYDERLSGIEDLELFLRLADRYAGANLQEPLYQWRKTRQGGSNIGAAGQTERCNLARKIFQAKTAGDMHSLEELYTVFQEHYNKTTIYNSLNHPQAAFIYYTDLAKGLLKHGGEKDFIRSSLNKAFSIHINNKLVIMLYMASYLPNWLKMILCKLFYSERDNNKGIVRIEDEEI